MKCIGTFRRSIQALLVSPGTMVWKWRAAWRSGLPLTWGCVAALLGARSSELCLPGNSGILSSAVPGELMMHNPVERPTAQQALRLLFGVSRGRHGCVNACFVMLVLRLVLPLHAD